MIVLWILLGIVGLILGLAILDLLVLMLSTAFVPKKEYDKNSRYYRFLLNFHIALAMKILHVKVNVENGEALDGINGRFLFVSNHRSDYDPITALYAFKKHDLAFISKKENLNIPFVGGLIRKCCFMEIDRVNPRNAVKTLKRASELIVKNEASVGVYPEGTRSKDCSLLPFHDGVFKIAKTANVPVAVIAVTGTEKIRKNIPFKKSVVNIKVLKIIPVEEVATLTTHELAADAKNEMARALEA